MTSEMPNKDSLQLLSIALGWALGILSTLIVDKLRKLFLKTEIKKGILAELKELQIHLTGICSGATTDSLGVSPEWAKWIRPYFEKMFDPEAIDYIRDKNHSVAEIVKLSDDEFYKLQLLMQTKKQQKTSLTFANISTPYLNSKYDSISSFKQDFQLLISKLRRQIEFLNNDFAQCWFYHSKTFEKITDLNHDVAVHNIEQIVIRIARRSEATIKLIQKIIDL